MRRLLWNMAVLTGGVLFLGLALLVVALGTEAGSRHVLERASALAPGELGFDYRGGTLLTGVGLDNVRYEHGATLVTLERLDWSLSVPALLRRTLRFPVLEARQLEVHLPPEEDPDAATELPDVHLPLRITTPGARIHGIRLLRANQEPLELDILALRGAIGGDRLNLQALRLARGDDRIVLAGHLGLTMPWELDIQADWRLADLPAAIADWTGPEQGASGDLQLGGNLEELNVTHRLRAPRAITTRGSVQLLSQPQRLDLRHHWEELVVQEPEGGEISLGSGSARTTGTPDDWQLGLEITDARIRDIPAQRLALTARGGQTGLTITEARLDSPHGRLRANGALEWKDDIRWQFESTASGLTTGLIADQAALDPELRQQLDRAGPVSLNARLRGDENSLALEQGSIHIDAGTLELQGHARWHPGLDWALSVHSRSFDPGPWLEQLPADIKHAPLSLAVRAEGDHESLEVTETHVRGEPGTMTINGTLDWLPEPAWDLHVNVRELNPGLFHAQFPGSVDFDTRISGKQPAEEPLELDVHLGHLEGSLREAPLQGRGHARLKGTQQIEIDMELSLSETLLQLKGQWNDQPDLHLNLNAPRLGHLWEQLGGEARMDLRVTGTRESPLVDGQVRGRDLALAGLGLDSLELDIHASDTPEQFMDLQLDAAMLRHRGETIVHAAGLRGEGTLTEHRIEWELLWEDEELTGAGQGGLDAENTWHGSLERLTARGPLTGDWNLQTPAGIRAGLGEAKMETLCLLERKREGRLCIGGEWQGMNSFQARASLREVPLAPLAALLPRPARLDGELNADADLSRRDGTFRGHLMLDAGAGKITVLGEEDEPDLQLPWQQARLNGRIDNEQLYADTEVLLDEHNRARGQLRAERHGDRTPLDGQLHVDMEELGWVELLAPRVRDVHGRIHGNLTLQGSFREPAFGGSLTLADGAADIPEIGVGLRQIRIHARSGLDGVLLVQGEAHSGEDGELEIDGRLDTGAKLPWPLHLRITGTDFEAVHRPDARAQLNPDLHITLAGTSVEVRGEVIVPRARLSPREIPQRAVRVSRDARMVTTTPETQPSPWQTDTDVRVILGDQVGIEGFGFTSRLTGEVRIQDRPGRPPHLTGEISMVGGRYRAWGQNLQVERGRIFFEGPPDNPGLDIVAVRSIPAHQVRAGLAISGTLRNPRTRVFSEPPMEETEAMSFLLTGRPLSGAGEGDAAIIMQAITRFGIERGEFITNPIGETLGVEVDVDTEGEFDETSLMLGRQLSSRLYLRYSIGLFESLNTVLLRYQLNPAVSLETRSSAESQSVDLIYRRER